MSVQILMSSIGSDISDPLQIYSSPTGTGSWSHVTDATKTELLAGFTITGAPDCLYWKVQDTGPCVQSLIFDCSCTSTTTTAGPTTTTTTAAVTTTTTAAVTTTTTAAATTTTTTAATTTTTTTAPTSRTLEVWFTSYAPTTYTTRQVSTSLDGELGVNIEIYYCGLEVSNQNSLPGSPSYSEFMTEGDGNKITYTAGQSGGKSAQIDNTSNDYSTYSPGYFTISSGFKIRDLGDMSTDWIVDANPGTNGITLSNGDTLNFEFYNNDSSMPTFGTSPS